MGTAPRTPAASPAAEPSPPPASTDPTTPRGPAFVHGISGSQLYIIPNPDDRSGGGPAVIGCSDVSLGFGGSSEPRGAGPALPGGPVSDRAVAPAGRLAPEPGPERAGGGAGHRLRAALGRRGRAPLRGGWAGRPGRPAARERGRQAAAGGRGRGGAAGRAGRAARRRGAVDGAEGGDVDGGPARPQGLAATRLGLPQETRLQRPAAPAAARQGGGPRGAGGVQKKLAAQVDEDREAEPGRPVEVRAFDEHRLGLKPVLRRQWAPEGQRPIAVGRHRYERLYLHGFVHPGTGEVARFVCGTVDTGLLSAVLAAFAAAVGAGEGKLIVLVPDNAGWHVSGDLVVPKGIGLAFLPAHTPELQPAEHLWPLADEAVANKHFATLKDLDAALSERCRTLAAVPGTVKAATHFGWWPTTTPASPPAL